MTTEAEVKSIVERQEKAAPLQFLDLRQQFEQIRDEVMRAVTGVLESQRFILGPEVEQLEKEMANYLGCRFAVACASGTDALILALMAKGIGPGDEVITTPFTFVATAGAIVRTGATPVFADIDPATYNLDPESAAQRITSKTRAVIPVHLFGLPAEMQPLMETAELHGIAVIEDAAQAIGATYHGRNVGTIGAMGCFSFFPSKNLGGAGDGGIITTNDPNHAERLRLLRVHGSRHKYQYEILGTNSRLDTLQAAIVRVKLRHLNDWTDKRRRNAERYRRQFAKSNVPNSLLLPAEPKGTRHVYNQFTMRCPQRDLLRDHLNREQIPTEIYYPYPLHLQPAFAYLGYKEGSLPHAEAAAREVLSVPNYPELMEDQQQMIVSAVARFFSQGSVILEREM
ncbi:MAG TPA: DegT/DnrJ/EryC1/StrS family aminotransferase [Candidatus Angelobacter sp.]|nr:DegT/DnrJ/EryC1/StrS family aminotransferase [Candidatus Angelobacter sp.]